MRRVLKRLGTALLFLAIAMCLAPTLVTPFLDRIDYRGPVTDHFDGQRFFNPDDVALKPSRKKGTFFSRWATGSRAKWPDHVPVVQTVPPRRVDGETMLITWIGHSTVLVQTQGLNILTDPIWSERASPFPFAGPKRVRAPGVAFDRLPKIDVVLVSHNHYDHMDLATLTRLWTRDHPLIVTSLGNDHYLKSHGIQAVAADWEGRISIRSGIDVVVERNHHWGSRWFTDRNRSLWSAFTIVLPGGNLFFGGDTGFGDGSWERAAAKDGPFRFAIIPIGTFLPRDVMQSNHIGPDEAMHIFETLKPGAALGVHWGTFQLSFERIDDPPHRLAVLRAEHPDAQSFITREVGQTFSVPALPDPSAAASAAARPSP